MAITNFTQEDLALMREWGRWIKEQQSNKPFRRGRETDGIQTPDVLIAKPQSAGGIPARVGDTPGSDTVDIYRIGSDGDLEVRGDTKLAFNLSTSVIAQDFIEIKRNKQGKYLASSLVAGDSGQARIVLFELDAVLAVTDASQANCPVDDFWHGTDPGATITVFNPAASVNNMFSGSSGAKGFASYDDLADRYWIFQLECT